MQWKWNIWVQYIANEFIEHSNTTLSFNYFIETKKFIKEKQEETTNKEDTQKSKTDKLEISKKATISNRED